MKGLSPVCPVKYIFSEFVFLKRLNFKKLDFLMHVWNQVNSNGIDTVNAEYLVQMALQSRAFLRNMSPFEIQKQNI